MQDNHWKWKLNDTRTQGRYLDKGMIQKEEVEKQLKGLPDLSANATWVEIDMEECQIEGGENASSETGNNHFNSEENS